MEPQIGLHIPLRPSGGLASTVEPGFRSFWPGAGGQVDRDQPAGESDNPGTAGASYVPQFVPSASRSSARPARHRRRQEWIP